MIIISLNDAESKDSVILAHVTTLLEALNMKVDFVSSPAPVSEVMDNALTAPITGNVPAPSAPLPGPTAAQVFGQTPIPAPPSAAVVPLPNAPVAPPVSGTPAAPPVPPAPAPTPAASAPVPSGSAGPSNPAPSGATVDKEGLPWDARIHASTKGMNADGTWRAKRGLNDANYVAAVKNELRSLMGAPAPALPPVPPVAAASTPAAAPSLPPLPASTAAAAPPLPPSGSPAPVPPAGGATDAPPVNEYARFLTEVAQTKTNDEVLAAIAALAVPGLTNVMTLAHRHDMIPALRNVLGMPQ